jgi:5-methylcytosine-specific restriction protein A
VEGIHVSKVRVRVKRRERFADMNRDYPKRKDAEGYWLCRWCGCRLVAVRRTSFCSTQCRDEVRIRCGFGVRSMVRRRDKGVCAKCGRDTNAIRRQLTRTRNQEGWKAVYSLTEALGIPKDRAFKSLWDADHIVPVREGGGTCGIEGYQTLCVWCHAEKTKARKRS